MKKILLILNESRIPQQVITKAIQIAKHSNSLLAAVFINDINGLNLGYPFPNDLYLLEENVRTENRKAESSAELENIAQVFKDQCNEKGIQYTIELNNTLSFKHLISLSAFADLIIADSKSDSDEYSLKDLLADAHCPTLLISTNAEPVKKIFVAYDGSASSMYALKMFSYIFPEYINFNINFFQISNDDIDEIPHLEEIKSWANMHFTNIDFQLLKGGTRKMLLKHIRHNSGKNIIVMGAYGGSSIARLFLKSTADSIINETNASVFIAHQ